jgi:hypothetical protein
MSARRTGPVQTENRAGRRLCAKEALLGQILALSASLNIVSVRAPAPCAGPQGTASRLATHSGLFDLLRLADARLTTGCRKEACALAQFWKRGASPASTGIPIQAFYAGLSHLIVPEPLDSHAYFLCLAGGIMSRQRRFEWGLMIETSQCSTNHQRPTPHSQI